MSVKSDYRRRIRQLLADDCAARLTEEDRITLFKKELHLREKSHIVDSNARTPWRDDEIELVLGTPNTPENIIRLGKALCRGAGAIGMVYIYANEPRQSVRRRLGRDNIFIDQIQRVASRVRNPTYS